MSFTDGWSKSYSLGNVVIPFGAQHLFFNHVFWYNDTLAATFTHSHKTYELHTIFSGEAVIFVNDNAFRLAEGDFFLISPNVAHVTSAPNKVKRCVLNFSIEPNMPEMNRLFNIPQVEQQHSIPAFLQKNDYWILKDQDELLDTLGEFLELQLKHSYGYSIKSQFLMASLMFNFFTKIGLLPLLEEKNTGTYPQAGEIGLYILTQYTEDITTASLAQRFNYSSRQISRIVADYYNSTVNSLLTECRVLHAKILINSTPLSIEEIAQQVGFKSVSTFYKAFKTYTGLSPNECRNNANHT